MFRTDDKSRSIYDHMIDFFGMLSELGFNEGEKIAIHLYFEVK